MVNFQIFFSPALVVSCFFFWGGIWGLFWVRDFSRLMTIYNYDDDDSDGLVGLGIKVVYNIMARWWFQIFFIFIPIWGNDPI